MNILDRIVKYKRQEVLEFKERYAHLEDLPLNFPNTHSLIHQLDTNNKISVIAEIKKGSPSKGHFAKNLDVSETATFYERGGASCISVLTDYEFFFGGFNVLETVRKTVDLPLLCKDFIIDDIQVKMAKYFGANVILLIKRILSLEQFKHLLMTARNHNLEVLVEVDSLDEFLSIANCDFKICGVNNRNLADFAVSLDKTKALAVTIKAHNKYLISESGIHNVDQIKTLREFSIDGVLVGESLIKDHNKNLLSQLQLKRVPMLTKVCGIKTKEHVLILEELNVEYIGFVFANSKRQVTTDFVKEMRPLIKTALVVGVFLNQTPQFIERTFVECRLDYVQVHGEFDFEHLNIPRSSIIKAFSYTEDHPIGFPIMLMDGSIPGEGKTYDLNNISKLESCKYLLAGGLDSNNVTLRANQFQADIVDVSSGVETNGVKDVIKIKEFIEKVRNI